MKHSNDELFSIGIKQWENFDGAFEGSDILIGNGFSINLWSNLSYKHLYEIFKKYSNQHLHEIFEKLKTSNFEMVIDSLIKTKMISHILSHEIEEIDNLIIQLKEGLINTIQDTHPTWKDTNLSILRSLSYELRQFDEIYTTNYDVFLYKIILAYNNLVELNRVNDGRPYEDSFYEEINETELGFAGPIDNDSRKIYYLHGSLFFYITEGKTIKIRKIDGSLEYIKLIKRRIENGEFPVFVAEGSYQDKITTIGDNYYLSYCLNALKQKRKSNKLKMVAYGFSFSSPDRHITDMIIKSGIKEIAISIYPNSTLEELQLEMSRISTNFGTVSVEFYDSRSLFTFDKVLYDFS